MNNNIIWTANPCPGIGYGLTIRVIAENVLTGDKIVKTIMFEIDETNNMTLSEFFY